MSAKRSSRRAALQALVLAPVAAVLPQPERLLTHNRTAALALLDPDSIIIDESTFMPPGWNPGNDRRLTFWVGDECIGEATLTAMESTP